jgi:hypothetical protein
MTRSLMKLLPAGAGINPRTGIITLRDGTMSQALAGQPFQPV